MFTDYCLAQPSLNKLPLAADENAYRNPSQMIVQRMRETLEHSDLNGKSTSKSSPQDLGNPMEEKEERL